MVPAQLDPETVFESLEDRLFPLLNFVDVAVAKSAAAANGAASDAAAAAAAAAAAEVSKLTRQMVG